MAQLGAPLTAGSEGLVTDPAATGVGANQRRPEAAEKVSGRFVYATDLMVEGMLWGGTLRSPHASARVLHVNVEPAKAMAGVHAALASWDVPCNRCGMLKLDQPVLADERVTYVGEPVAIVAADDPELVAVPWRPSRSSTNPCRPVWMRWISSATRPIPTAMCCWNTAIPVSSVR